MSEAAWFWLMILSPAPAMVLIGLVLNACSVRVRPVETRIIGGVSVTGIFRDGEKQCKP